MSDKNIPPELFAGLAPLWVFFLGLLGALVGYLEDFRHDDSPKIKAFKAATRIASSAFAAVLTWHAIKALGVPIDWHVPIVGISGHMGVEATKFAGELLKGWLNRKVNGAPQ